ncbi:MAG: hypothetical protein P4L43_15360 [Syntrophobacteraceae bacterium]|nr:hypothetical protein [Syntrophobacteraceae bacterium]
MGSSKTEIVPGKVIAINKGAVAAKVIIDTGDGSIITHIVAIDDVYDLNIAKGDEIFTVVRGKSMRLMKKFS